ncbi:MAG: ABC transporter substrate-binding protein [Hyphomicrobiaceae bacterium]|nr:ABC transporter substrate-binding protein [Hyphomicrobiaceae bacterium]
MLLRKRRHAVLGALAGFAAALAIAGSASPADAQGKGETLKIQDYPGVGNMLTRVAASKGFCKARGITCQLQSIPTGPLGATALISKSIDVGFFPPETQIAANVKGASLRAVASGAVLNVYLIAARADLDLPNAGKGFPDFVADLKGKKIGVTARGSAAEIMFAYLVKKAGFKAEDFTYVAVGAPNTAYGALASKQVDANMTFEPSGALCEVLKTCRVLYRAALSEKPAELFAVNGAASNMVVTQETLDKNGAAVEALVNALKDAEAFIQDPKNFDEALKIAESYFKFEFPKGDEVMKEALKTAIPAYKASISRTAVKAIGAYLLETGQIETAVDPAKLVWEKAPNP